MAQCISCLVTKAARKPGGRLKALHLGVDPPREIEVVCTGMPPAFLRSGVVVSIRGIWEKEGTVFKTPGGSDIAPAFLREDMDVLLAHGYPAVDWKAVMAALGMRSLRDVFWYWVQVPEEAASRAAAALGEDAAARVGSTISRFYASNDVPLLADLLGDALGADLPDVYDIYDFLRHRAARRNTTVCEMLKANPHMLAEVEGWTVGDADKLYEYLHRKRPGSGHQGRAVGVFRSVLWLEARAGNSYLPYSSFISRCKARGVDGSLIYSMVFSAGTRDSVHTGVCAEGAGTAASLVARALMEAKGEDVSDSRFKSVYFRGTYFSERDSAAELVRFISDPVPLERRQVVAKALEKLSSVPGFDVHSSADQVDAVLAAFTYRLAVITGAAGTGKSEVLAAAAAAAVESGLNVLLASPTGIAAQRLSGKIRNAHGVHVPSMTLHLSMGVRRGVADLAEPEETAKKLVEADFVLVDEASMMDVVLFRRLVHRLKPGAQVVLAGDPNQLGAPGPGRVLEDLAEAALLLAGKGFSIAHVPLKKIRRAGDALVEAAHGVLSGRFPSPGGAVKTLAAAGKDSAARAVVGLVKDLAVSGVPLEDVMVLVPHRRVRPSEHAALTSQELNLLLQRELNPGGAVVEGTHFRVGDRVICCENDYPSDPRREVHFRRTVYNGETGRVTGFNPKTGEVAVSYGAGDQQVYTPDECMRYLELAYALTVHKAQGGEAPVVVFACTAVDKRLVNRRAFYTALTRCKSDPGKHYSGRVYFVTVENSRSEVEEALMEQPRPRASKLAARLLVEAGLTATDLSGGRSAAERKISGVVVESEPAVVPMIAAPPEQS